MNYSVPAQRQLHTVAKPFMMPSMEKEIVKCYEVECSACDATGFIRISEASEAASRECPEGWLAMHGEFFCPRHKVEINIYDAVPVYPDSEASGLTGRWVKRNPMFKWTGSLAYAAIAEKEWELEQQRLATEARKLAETLWEEHQRLRPQGRKPEPDPRFALMTPEQRRAVIENYAALLYAHEKLES